MSVGNREFRLIHHIAKPLPLDVNMLLIIDNYDSFTFNLKQVVGNLGVAGELSVVRNDETDVAGIVAMKPSAIIISPGPCTPVEAGISNAVIQHLHGSIPILGVCLGHQCIASIFGAHVVQAPKIVHGKTSLVNHDRQGLFREIDSPIQVMRYHSLHVENAEQLTDFIVSAWTEDGICMALRHRTEPLFGVQFHPESFMTPTGTQVLANFLDLAFAWNQHRPVNDTESHITKRDTTTP